MLKTYLRNDFEVIALEIWLGFFSEIEFWVGWGLREVKWEKKKYMFEKLSTLAL